MAEDGEGLVWKISIDVDETEQGLMNIEAHAEQIEEKGQKAVTTARRATQELAETQRTLEIVESKEETALEAIERIEREVEAAERLVGLVASQGQEALKTTGQAERELETVSVTLEEISTRHQTVQGDVNITVSTLHEILDAVLNRKESLEQAIRTVFTQVPRMDQALETVEQQRRVTEKAIEGTVNSSYAILNAVSRSFQNMVGIFSQFLSPLQQALTTAIFTVIDVMVAIATSQYTNPYTFWIGIAMTVASTTLAIVGAAAVEQGFSNVQSQMQQANQIISQAVSIVTPIVAI